MFAVISFIPNILQHQNCLVSSSWLCCWQAPESGAGPFLWHLPRMVTNPDLLSLVWLLQPGQKCDGQYQSSINIWVFCDSWELMAAVGDKAAPGAVLLGQLQPVSRALPQGGSAHPAVPVPAWPR